MATSSLNKFVGPQDGWVQIAPTASKFLRVTGYPHTHPFYLYFGSSAPSLVPVPATGTATFSVAAPAAGGTITVGTEVYTFRAAASLPFEVTIGADFHASATNFTAIVNAQSQLVTAVDVADVVTLTTKAKGAASNIGLSKTATNVAVSGATLTGGADVPLGILLCHKAFWSNILTDQPLFARVPNPVRDSNGGSGQLRIDVVSIQ